VLDDPAVQAGLADLALGERGRLTVSAPLRRTGGSHPTWHGRGRLHGRGPRIARSTPVELELRAWSATSVELRLRPTSRAPWRWGRRRARRYFDLAHLAADQLAAGLRLPAPSPEVMSSAA
jgi:hypothetical protein